MEQNLYLCGFMGCGKTTVGKWVASKLGFAFYDLDDEIVKRAGMTIRAIFDLCGEEYFRDLEQRILKELGEYGRCVIATGGGAMLSQQNAAFARQNGMIVYLDVPFDVCYGRIRGDKSRPIAAASTQQQLRERYESRKTVYTAHADVTVTLIDQPPKACADAVCAAVYEYLQQNETILEVGEV